MPEISFKERVKNIAIQEAINYKRNFVDCEYLICSDAFTLKSHYIIDAKPDNFQHLIGVNSLISPQLFYNKCCDGTLEESDFNFIKRGQSEVSVKGSVRRKIVVLPKMVNIFQNTVMVEESFVKNQIFCTFAASDGVCTLGFIDSSKSRPMSLVKGNELNLSKAKTINILLSRGAGEEKFTKVIVGDFETLTKHYEILKEHIDESIFDKLNLL